MHEYDDAAAAHRSAPAQTGRPAAPPPAWPSPHPGPREPPLCRRRQLRRAPLQEVPQQKVLQSVCHPPGSALLGHLLLCQCPELVRPRRTGWPPLPLGGAAGVLMTQRDPQLLPLHPWPQAELRQRHLSDLVAMCRQHAAQGVQGARVLPSWGRVRPGPRHRPRQQRGHG